MSQDLLAAFENIGSSQTNQGSSERSEISSRSTTFSGDHKITGNEAGAEDDDFGDFEDAAVPRKTEAVSQPPLARPTTLNPASPTFPPKAVKTGQKPPDRSAVGRHPFADHMDLLFGGDDDEYDAGADDMGDLSTNPEAAMAYSKRIIAEQEEQTKKHKQKQKPVAVNMPSASTAKPLKHSLDGLQTRSGRPAVKDPDILFDAENLSDVADDDDDFGDFEDGVAHTPQKASTEFRPQDSKSRIPNIDLLGLEESPQKSAASYKNLQHQHRLTSIEVKQHKLNGGPTLVKPAPQVVGDDTWDDFEEFTPISNISPANFHETLKDQPPNTTQNSHASNQDSRPPTNVPPPAVLLSIFPSLITSAQETLLDPLAKMDSTARHQLLAHTATHQLLRSYITQATVLGHIIAGRKSRWKRDQFLAQGMRIGPAGSKSGMKLAGIDRSEAAKEDREVLDTVRLWRTQAGRLRGAMATASAAASNANRLPSTIPDIAEQLPVKALKSADGGITAPHACALCGLKREERVAKVDVGVDDSFGEWWVEGMNMHLSCRKFWDEHKDRLRSR